MTNETTTTSLQKLLEILMHRSMKNFIVYLKAQDLSMSHIGAMFVIHRLKSCGVSEIGESLGITTAGTSQMLNRLVEDGLIERTEDAEDRRAKRIVLTSKGHDTLLESLHERQHWVHDLVGSLNADELDLVTRAVNVLLDKAGQNNPAMPSNHPHTEY